MAISVRNASRYPEAAASDLRPWLQRLVVSLAPAAASFNVRFTGDPELRRLNESFRGVAETTDVLSFPGDATPEGAHLGDVVISVPAARRQARAAGHALSRELRILVLHGLLHCLGYDHERDGGEMEALEGQLRRRWIEVDA